MDGQATERLGALDRFFHRLDRFNHWTGRAVSFLAVVMMLTIMYEVIARYFFNAPTLWATELNIYLLCAYVLLAGGATHLTDGHVRVDIFWSTLSPRGRALADIVTSLLFFAFCVALVWKGSEMVIRSIADKSTSAEAMAWPLFPSQLTVPLGGLLLGLQGVAKLRRDIATLRRGEVQ
ncbi:MAG: TRAP transporter small permease subunit [Thermodesulfobacteriota bacterium]